MCDAEVPCGVVAAKVFANAQVTVTPAAREANVKATLAVVQTGEVDAGVVYVTDVKAAGSAVLGRAHPGQPERQHRLPDRATEPFAELRAGPGVRRPTSCPRRAWRC